MFRPNRSNFISDVSAGVTEKWLHILRKGEPWNQRICLLTAQEISNKALSYLLHNDATPVIKGKHEGHVALSDAKQ